MTINKSLDICITFKGDKAQVLSDWKECNEYTWNKILWGGYSLLKSREKALDYVQKHI
jgi:hypothetical protein